MLAKIIAHEVIVIFHAGLPIGGNGAQFRGVFVGVQNKWVSRFEAERYFLVRSSVPLKGSAATAPNGQQGNALSFQLQDQAAAVGGERIQAGAAPFSLIHAEDQGGN